MSDDYGYGYEDESPYGTEYGADASDGDDGAGASRDGGRGPERTFAALPPRTAGVSPRPGGAGPGSRPWRTRRWTGSS